ncbi:MAG: hypothetical protein RL885_16125 [Planctomycetota bacterium]
MLGWIVWILGWIVWIFGAFICVVNFYLTFLRYPIIQAKGKCRDDYRFISGVPLFGSTFVIFAWVFWIRHEGSLLLDVATWSLAVFDTGGIHWLLAMEVWQWLEDRRGADAESSEEERRGSEGEEL